MFFTLINFLTLCKYPITQRQVITCSHRQTWFRSQKQIKNFIKHKNVSMLQKSNSKSHQNLNKWVYIDSWSAAASLSTTQRTEQEQNMNRRWNRIETGAGAGTEHEQNWTATGPGTGTAPNEWIEPLIPNLSSSH